MGLSNFPCPADGVIPMLVMNTILSVTLLKNMMMRYVLHVVGSSAEENYTSNFSDDFSSSVYHYNEAPPPPRRRRRISTTRYEALCRSRFNEEDYSKCRSTSSSKNGKNGKNDDENKNTWSLMECCVCLNRFEGDEQVSELSCKHFFHKGCLAKWFDNQHTTCPLCRSIL